MLAINSTVCFVLIALQVSIRSSGWQMLWLAARQTCRCFRQPAQQVVGIAFRFGQDSYHGYHVGLVVPDSCVQHQLAQHFAARNLSSLLFNWFRTAPRTALPSMVQRCLPGRAARRGAPKRAMPSQKTDQTCQSWGPMSARRTESTF